MARGPRRRRGRAVPGLCSSSSQSQCQAGSASQAVESSGSRTSRTGGPAGERGRSGPVGAPAGGQSRPESPGGAPIGVISSSPRKLRRVSGLEAGGTGTESRGRGCPWAARPRSGRPALPAPARPCGADSWEARAAAARRDTAAWLLSGSAPNLLTSGGPLAGLLRPARTHEAHELCHCQKDLLC